MVKSCSAISQSKVEYAQALAAKGCRIFPLPPNSKEPACKWLDVATTDPVQIAEWFAANPDINYGVAFGPGQHALDIDMKEGRDGMNAIARLELQNTDLPPTFMVRTASGGFHCYFNGAAHNSADLLGDGLDIRGGEPGHSGYVLGPGSMIDGKPYTVINDTAIADAPAWYMDAIKPVKQAILKAKPGLILDTPEELAWVRNHLTVLVAANDVAVEGNGGNTRANKLFNAILDRGISPEMAYKLVDEIWNPVCWPSFNPYELSVLCNSSARSRQNDIGAKAEPPASETFKEVAATVAPLVPEQEQEAERFEILEPWQFKDRPAPKWIVDGILAAKRTHILFGESETFKTFLTLDLLASITHNVKAFGQFEVYEPGDTVFFCDEDPDDLMLIRYPAWCKARGVENPFAKPGPGPGRFVVIPRCPLIIDPTDTDAAIALIKKRGIKPKVVAVDTWAKAMTGMNEDSAKDTGLLFQAMGVMRREFNCATWLTHHPKKNDSGTMRGSGSQQHGGDIVWNAERKGEAYGIKWTNKKIKGGARPKPFYVAGQLHLVDDQFDPHGVQITAPVFTVASAPPPERKPVSMTAKQADRLEATQQLEQVADAIRAIYAAHSITRDNALSTKALAHLLAPQLENETNDDHADRITGMIARLRANGRETSLGSGKNCRGPFQHLWRMVARTHDANAGRDKRWFPQSDA